MKLTNRLRAVADYAESGSNIADIGSDHGYIPIYLAENGHIGRLAASDVNEGPIGSARNNARDAGVGDRIEFYHADGLKGIDSGFDTIVIAGMGGELMVKILDEAPFPLDGKRLILQPQSKIPELVSYLYEQDILICRARFVRDMGRDYAVFDTIAGEKWSYEPDEGEKLIPRELREDSMYPEYRERTAEKLRKAIEGLESAEKPDEREIEKIENLITQL